MQTSEIISVNIWQIVVSLLNLLLLFLILKKFLFKPVKNILKTRQDNVDSTYAEAKTALDEANASKKELEAKLSEAHLTADSILQEATVNAERRRDRIIDDASKEAEAIMRQAKVDAELERMKRLASMGGFIPCPDHRIMPGSKFELVQYYAEEIKKIRI